MGKVNIESYQLRVNNSSEESRTYDIACSVNLRDGKIKDVNGGTVTLKDGRLVADFYCWENKNLSVTYREISSEEQCAVNVAINDFLTSVEEPMQTTA